MGLDQRNNDLRENLPFVCPADPSRLNQGRRKLLDSVLHNDNIERRYRVQENDGKQRIDQPEIPNQQIRRNQAASEVHCNEQNDERGFFSGIILHTQCVGVHQGNNHTHHGTDPDHQKCIPIASNDIHPLKNIGIVFESKTSREQLHGILYIGHARGKGHDDGSIEKKCDQ